MPFIAEEIAIELVSCLRVPVAQIGRHDRDLASQVRRAASSVALNLGESEGRFGTDRTHSIRIAAGSACEVQCALRVAVAWGYLEPASVAPALQLLHRLGGMLWRLAPPAVTAHGR